MNRYEIDGIIKDLKDGNNIIICADHSVSRLIFNQVVSTLDDRKIKPENIIRANGQEKIYGFHGGSLSFARTPGELMKKRANTVLLSVGVRESSIYMEHWLPVASKAVTGNYPGDVEQISI